MRDRFTVADLAYLLGGWEDAVLAEAAALGAGIHQLVRDLPNRDRRIQ